MEDYLAVYEDARKRFDRQRLIEEKNILCNIENYIEMLENYKNIFSSEDILEKLKTHIEFLKDVYLKE